MAHVWDQLILGGTDKPRILSIDNNLCSNPFFTKNTSGWTFVPIGFSEPVDVFTRSVHPEANGEFMGRIKYTTGKGYAEYTYDFGDSIEDKIFFIMVDVISACVEGFTISLFGDTEFSIHHFNDPVTDIRKFFIIATATAQTSETIQLRIYGTRSEPGDLLDADLYFDNVYLGEVIHDIEMPQPHDSGKILFEKLMIGENTLLTNKHNQFRVKWKPNYLCEYIHLTKEFEEYREIISKANFLFCIPHLDVEWGFVCKWMPNYFLRSYVFNEYVGHSGVIELEGNEYLIRKPNLKVGD